MRLYVHVVVVLGRSWLIAGCEDVNRSDDGMAVHELGTQCDLLLGSGLW